MTEEQVQTVVAEVFSLYEQYGNDDYIGEPVSQIEHMCQAAELALADGYDDEVVLAAFFHDIGHLCEHILTVDQMDGFGVVNHELLAGRYLRHKGFSEKIALLVENHVQAKRYLTYLIPSYYEKLSEASRFTLTRQGGVMNKAEASVFETDPLHPMYIRMREWDDLAKEEGKALPVLEVFKEMAVRHLRTQN